MHPTDAHQVPTSPSLHTPGAASPPPGLVANAMSGGMGMGGGMGGMGGMGGGMGMGGMGQGGFGQMPPNMGGGYGNPFGTPGSGAPAGIGDCFQTVMLLGKRSIPVLAVAWFSTTLLYLLFCCPSYLVSFLPLLDQYDLATTLGTGFAATCIGLLGKLGQILAGCLQLGLMKSARVAVVEGVDNVGGLGGAFKAAFSKIVAAFILLIITAILSAIGFALCVIPGFLVLGFMMLVNYLVIAVEISIGDAFKEAIRLVKAAWLPLTVMTFIACIVFGFVYGGGIGITSLFAAILEDKAFYAIAPCNYLWGTLFQFVAWIFFTGTVMAIETRDANVTYAQG